MSPLNPVNEQSKDQSLEEYREGVGDRLATDQGVPISTTDDSLKAGSRGPTLEGFIGAECA